MPVSLLLRTLQELRRSMLTWGAVVGIFSAGLVGAYPLLRKAAQPFGALFSAGDLLDMSAPDAWLSAVGFDFVLPWLVCTFALLAGSRLFVSQEAQSLFSLLLAYPQTRSKLLGERVAGLALAILAMVAWGWVVLVVSTRLAGWDVSALNLAAACLSLVLLGLTFGGLGLALSLWTSSLALSRGIGLAFLLFSYLVYDFPHLLPNLSWLAAISPFTYAFASRPLQSGWSGGPVILAGATALLVWLAWMEFNRRDVMVEK
ncbi:MAG: ABC transporter permease subunit [Chloroflexi bacterium]|jgi:ABC-2 type transport system permease protein|nr:ABC transporter permease subunit [Chloroflexota bacterium]